MKLKYLFLLLMILAMVCMTFPAMAQDATEEVPTVEGPVVLTDTPVVVTVVPTAIPTQPPVTDGTDTIGGLNSTQLFAIFAFLFVLVQGVIAAVRERSFSKLLDGYKAALERKDVRDQVETEYLKSSMQIKDFVALVKNIVQVIDNMNIPIVDDFVHEGDEFIDDVTDGQPNI